MATQQIRRSDGRGRHTTTFRALIPLPGGGAVLDTPGIRAVGVFDGSGLDQAFSDIEALAAGCRFTDCGHGGEPGLRGVGRRGERRTVYAGLDSWRKLHRELRLADAAAGGPAVGAGAVRVEISIGRRDPCDPPGARVVNPGSRAGNPDRAESAS